MGKPKNNISIESALQDAYEMASELLDSLNRDEFPDIPSANEYDVINDCIELMSSIRSFREEAEERKSQDHFERFGDEASEHRMSVKEFL